MKHVFRFLIFCGLFCFGFNSGFFLERQQTRSWQELANRNLQTARRAQEEAELSNQATVESQEVAREAIACAESASAQVVRFNKSVDQVYTNGFKAGVAWTCVQVERHFNGGLGENPISFHILDAHGNLIELTK